MSRTRASQTQGRPRLGVWCRAAQVAVVLAAALAVSVCLAAETPAAAGWSGEGLVAFFLFAPPVAGMPEVTPEIDHGMLSVVGDIAEPIPEEPGVLISGERSALDTQVPPQRLIAALRASGELTLEAWLKPDNLTQSGPARIVTLSRDTGSGRNFTLGQAGNCYAFRLRTTAPAADQGFVITEVQTEPGSVPGDAHHVVVTYLVCPRCDACSLRIYINGELKLQRQDITGDLSTWDLTFPLLLGNEATMDRQWHGALYLVALYNRALTAGEIKTHFDVLRSAAETVPEP